MTTVWVPEAAGVSLLGPLPSGVAVEVWDGDGAKPSPGGPELWVVPWIPRADYAEVMAGMPRLRVVQTLTAGYDHVLPYVPSGVTLCNAAGVHDAGVAEWVMAALLAMLRDLPDHFQRQREGTPRRAEGEMIAGKTVLILGHGQIGRAVERRLAGFEASVVGVASAARDGVHGPEALPELLPRADVLVVLVPLRDSTRGLIGAAELSRLPDGAVIVNAARGGVVDQEALLPEVRSGRLRAALDVGEPDPLPGDHPLLAEPGVLYTPHVAGATTQTLPRVYALVGDQARRLTAGEPLRNVVRPGAADPHIS